jgi:uncharacterized lipoprotein YehR (DUF1307 family)
MNRKEPLGFKTPSMRIQEDYKEILEQITAKKADWDKTLTSTLERTNNFIKSSDDFIKRIGKIEEKEITHEDSMELEHITIEIGQLLTRALLAKIGMELAGCDVRIATIEKELRDLRKGL